MRKGTRLALIPGSVPFVTLVLALPFVNRLEPMILGLPFILFWIMAWVALTPPLLWAAHALQRKYDPPDPPDPPADSA